jgi:hypothetical protein
MASTFITENIMLLNQVFSKWAGTELVILFTSERFDELTRQYVFIKVGSESVEVNGKIRTVTYRKDAEAIASTRVLLEYKKIIEFYLKVIKKLLEWDGYFSTFTVPKENDDISTFIRERILKEVPDGKFDNMQEPAKTLIRNLWTALDDAVQILTKEITSIQSSPLNDTSDELFTIS